MNDFDNAIALHKSNLKETNAVIQEAGLKKLKIMENAAIFRSKVRCQEWRHRMLKMKIEDMNSFRNTIEKCKVTKEIQVWLEHKKKGWTEDLTDDAIDQEVQKRILAYERSQGEMYEPIAEKFSIYFHSNSIPE